jgi:hypothetical protein
MGFNPPPPPSAYGTATPQAVKQGTSTNETVNIYIDEVDNNEANRPGKKRYWTYEDEERLVITDPFSYFAFYRPVLGTILVFLHFLILYFVFCIL